MNNLVEKDKYSVSILACPSSIPFNFARHPWFLLNKKGVLSRWEVKHFKNKDSSHLFVDDQPPFQGINLTFFIKKYFWQAGLVGHIEGGENSTAQKIVEFIENSEKTYPYLNGYSLLGPNSNTYVQWVLDKFPEFNIKLSWRFIGKGFKVKE